MHPSVEFYSVHRGARPVYKPQNPMYNKKLVAGCCHGRATFYRRDSAFAINPPEENMENLSQLYRVWTEIDLDALLHNYRQIQKTAGDTPVMPVVKADAYGQGAAMIAATLQKEAGVRQFAVVTQEEALHLRKSGITGMILMMGTAPAGSISALQKADISLCVPSLSLAKAYTQAAGGRPLKVHLKLDTGMSRLGMREACAVEECLAIAALDVLQIEGIFTQLSSSDLPQEDAFTGEQHRCFCRVAEKLKEKGLAIPLRHCANSAALVGLPGTHEDVVRSGLALYGYQSREEDLGLDLRPILSWGSSVVQCKEVPEGGSVGYDRGYRSPGPKRIATVPVGYADGLLRGIAAGGGQLLVRGKKAPIVGKICMDMCMLDVSDIEGVCEGDLVTLIGVDGENRLSADDMAKTLGTINYEVLCCLGKRVPRLYRKNGLLDAENPHWCWGL